MLEIYSNQESSSLNRVTIDLIRDGEAFLSQYEDINHELMLDTVSVVYRYLSRSDKIPHNIYKFFIGAYYIVIHHPRSYPIRETKNEFCDKFLIKLSSLEYTVEKIADTLGMIRMVDDRHFCYYMSKNDMGFKLIINLIKGEVEKEMMNFLLTNQPINSQILSERLINTILFDMKIFHEELFRPLFDIVQEIVEFELLDYAEYSDLQEQVFHSM